MVDLGQLYYHRCRVRAPLYKLSKKKSALDSYVKSLPVTCKVGGSLYKGS